MKMGSKVFCLLAFAATAADTRRRLGYVMDDTTIRTAVAAWLDDPTAAEVTYGHISTWDTSGVTDMSELFKGASSFNEDISAWDTSSVTTMRYMFSGASSFNSPIGKWQVGKVTDMTGMFKAGINQPSSFNQPIGGWQVDRVTSFYDMFRYASSFNQDLSNWRVDKATGCPDDPTCTGQGSVAPMGFMFQDAIAFDQDLGWCVEDHTFGNPWDEYVQEAFRNTLCASINCGVTRSCDTVDSAFSVARTPAVAVVTIFAVLFGIL